MVRMTSYKRRADLCVVEAIDIESAPRTVARMEPLARPVHITHGDVERKAGIHRAPQRVASVRPVEIETDRLATRMDPCVRAPSPCYPDIRLSEPLERPLQLSLNRASIALHLETAVCSPVILYRCSIANARWTIHGRLSNRSRPPLLRLDQLKNHHFSRIAGARSKLEDPSIAPWTL